MTFHKFKRENVGNENCYKIESHCRLEEEGKRGRDGRRQGGRQGGRQGEDRGKRGGEREDTLKERGRGKERERRI